MKKVHLLAMLLFTACVVPVSQAQESLFLKDPSTKNKLLQLDLDVGTCFDLAYRGKGNMYTAMSDRKSVFPAINLRLQHFFSRKEMLQTKVDSRKHRFPVRHCSVHISLPPISQVKTGSHIQV